MKKITLLLFLFTTIIFSQTNPIDFESGGNGASWTWNVFEADTPPLDFVTNLDATGNTSTTVAKITVKQGGADYAGTNTTGQGVFDLTTANSVVRIWVYKSVISDVGIKFEQGAASTGEIKVANTKINEWEELVFDMSSKIGEPSSTGITGLVVFPDFDARTQDNIIYFDNITFSDISTLPNAPTTEAPTPTQNESNVISLFSDAYTNVAVDNFISFSNGATLEDVSINGNAVKKYSNLDYVGIETLGANLVNASTMTTFHIDIWTPDANNFKIKLVDFGADQSYQGGDDSEHEVVYGSTATGTWISYDIPLTDFAGLSATTNLAQYILSKNPGGTIYVDNIYFHNDAVALTQPQVPATAPTLAAADVYSLFSDTYTNNNPSSFTQPWGQGSVEDFVIGTNNIKKYTALNFQAITLSSTVDLADYTHIHLDVWTPEANAFGIKFQDFGVDNVDEYPNVDDSEMELQSTTTQSAGVWVGHDFAIADFTALTGTANLGQIQVLLGSATGGSQGTAFIDNIYLYKDATANVKNNDIASFNIFPNPTERFLNISSETYINKIKIYNVLGKEIKAIKINAKSKNINLQDLNAGIYMIKYLSENGIGTSKFIKQ